MWGPVIALVLVGAWYLPLLVLKDGFAPEPRRDWLEERLVAWKTSLVSALLAGAIALWSLPLLPLVGLYVVGPAEYVCQHLYNPGPDLPGLHNNLTDFLRQTGTLGWIAVHLSLVPPFIVAILLYRTGYTVGRREGANEAKWARTPRR